jgi:uncharacterized membrane protein YfcA
MIVAFARYSRDGSFSVLRRHGRLVALMALGSVIGTVLGGLLLGVVPDVGLVPFLAGLPFLRSIKFWGTSQPREANPPAGLAKFSKGNRPTLVHTASPRRLGVRGWSWLAWVERPAQHGSLRNGGRSTLAGCSGL